MAEGQILKLLAHALHPHATGKRSVNIKRFLGNPRAFLGRNKVQSPHIVQAIRQFHQQNADIGRDGQQ